MTSNCIVRPIILAGGLGTRLRPRTNVLPKPLLPVLGRPLLWYTLKSACHHDLRSPIVVLAYKAELIKAFFAGYDADFREMPNHSMAENFLAVAEADDSDAFLGMSSDVLLPGSVVNYCLEEFQKNECNDTVILARLPNAGHKKWEFDVEAGYLTDIRKSAQETPFERVLLILKKSSITMLRNSLPNPVTEDGLPGNLAGYQSGWTLLLKVLALSGTPIFAKVTNIPLCNINVQSDLDNASTFISTHRDTNE